MLGDKIPIQSAGEAFYHKGTATSHTVMEGVGQGARLFFGGKQDLCDFIFETGGLLSLLSTCIASAIFRVQEAVALLPLHLEFIQGRETSALPRDTVG
jgi:hypothetical protein